MRFNYNGNDYELAELKEPNKDETFDIIAVFRIHYCIWMGTALVEVNRKQYEDIPDNFEKLEMTDYFYGADEDDETLIETAKERLGEVLKDDTGC